MANRLTIPGLKKMRSLSGWPLVGVLGVALAVVALLYGGAMNKLDTTTCRMTVQADRVQVLSAPGPSGKPGETLTRGTEVGAERIVDTGYRKLTGGDRWVPANSVAATSGSLC